MIDLHVHSTASDGTLRPAEIARMGADCLALALTDHDTLAGAAEFLAEPDCRAIRLAGVELSVASDPGYGHFHLLGLGVDPAGPVLRALLEKAARGRDCRNPAIVAKLRALGVDVTMDDVAAESTGGMVARPHIARALVRKGFAASVQDAFRRYLAADAPAYVPRWRPPPADAFAAVHAAGGVAVMAHPRLWTSDPATLRSGLAKLKDEGLDGLEVFYSANTVDETRMHIAAARDLGLAMTAGSDFHGDNKPGVRFGMDVPDEKAFIAPLLERLGKK